MNSTAPNPQEIISELRRQNQALVMAAAENARLQAEHFHLASIVECSNDAIISIDLEDKIISWNKTAERMFGYTAAEAISRPCAILFPPDRLSEAQALLQRIKRGETIAHYETSRVRKDGAIILVSLTASPVRDPSGKITGLSQIVHDITEQRGAQDALKALQAEMSHMSRLNLMGTMASALAHEINQPLTATMNYVRAARRMLADKPDLGECRALLESAANETKLAGGIIRSLRTFIDKREVQRAPEDINTVLEDGLALSITVGPKHRKLIRRAFAPGLPRVLIQRVQIQQVMLNLVRNAFEAMGDMDDGKVVLETAPGERGFVLVSISDNGPGLPPEIAENLFKPFTTTKEKGMGVGLSICHSLIEAHGGRIWSEPNTPHGVVFHFQLPVARDGGDGN
jgi:two-component system sensor kinase FixL